MNVLVAEDENDIRNLLKLHLEENGYTVFSAADGLEALAIFKNNAINLGIFDVMMPRLDGFNLLRKIRETSQIPVIFLTARGSEMDKVLGLGLGGDDYLVKPFSMAELIARVSAHLRRNYEYSDNNQMMKPHLNVGNLCLDEDGCCLYVDGVLVELSAKEYLILQFLMKNPDKVFTKKQLYRQVWEEELYYDDNTIMVHISRLRNKLEADPRNPEYIKTIRGIGYKFQLPKVP
ncbi:response regulator transcription factor [Acetobacterium sp.]|jgi:DNA-binding response OmpR family regulator|uniref:response regulator transcription factor n=1 Tax=Acetobacterium sp. TaxID=1872094 RepID=UPI000CC2AB15|nr:response regulator transcription factor [Acetobacterium sp.]MDO9493026.1 response regulator transcription factor [Acetobacterium sp.]PKM71749.1 MAG: DNA-binding response regulator [Firmicutes bacterium HGW-Firmicutes-17]